ncbi:excalibur calcium-binding domain-containing protein [Corynebacterium pseudodiphtheriticum]|uniref:excalibur calcium-binding domain-containing protein n=1 Tax=Corynebacterium pseudodiphtheriticum TaxID=37637 RepID=UPI00254C5672|nr:excalibur calcium-binding domain-containing protein [Corynebacterium pseudodiphtheriticum]MDK8760801.1 excalibur calcium-binding domain-containing protein [Corynebacterium pseudodiphtheriticum]
MNSLRKTLLATLSTTCILPASCTDLDSSADQAMVTETSTETFTETATESAESMEAARAADAAENLTEANAHEHSGRGNGTNGTVLPERYDERFPHAQEAPADQPPAAEAPGAAGANPEMNEHPVAPAQVEAPAAPPAAPGAEPYFQNCAAARAAGAAPLHAGDPGYRSQLDRDKDGVACE